MVKLGKLHSQVMASVQKSVRIANISMLLDLQATQAILVDSNVEMKSLLISGIGSMPGTLPSKVRDEVVEASTSSFVDPKFWVDILAAVDNHNGKFPSPDDMGMFEDPITAHLMIDPIVCNDGNTYCRWTIIDNCLTTNPLNVDEELTIVVDNLAFRKGLFEKFPKQCQLFRQRRNEFREHALSLAGQGLLGDAMLALQYVLQWDKHDEECVECLAQVERAFREAKEMYLQPSLEPSLEFLNASASGLKMDGEDDGSLRELDEAEKLVENLSSSIDKVVQRQEDVMKQFLARGEIVDEYSYGELDECTILGLFHFLPKPQGLQEVLENIALVFNEGASASRANAESVLRALFASNNLEGFIINSRAMHALVISLGNGTTGTQFSAICALINVCQFRDNKMRAIQAGVVPMLLRVLVDHCADEFSSFLFYGLLLVAKFLEDAEACRVFRLEVPPSTFVDIMTSNEYRLIVDDAAASLYTLCVDDVGYRQQARACRIGERIAPNHRKEHNVVKLLNLLKY